MLVAVCSSFFACSLDAAEKAVAAVDVCIYGATSGGVVSAVQAARMGKSVIVLEPGKHVGGMTASGLSWTDVGSSDRMWIIGGLAKEFYQRVGKHYGQDPNTVFASADGEKASGGYDFNKPPSLSFEPKVAERVFNEWLRENTVDVRFDTRLKSLKKRENQIEEVVTLRGERFRAKMFIDASYEGDLMALAGVSYTVGREANSQYGETVNGIQGPATSTRGGKFDVKIDPFRVPGNPSSGILPYLLQSGPLGEIGSADKRVQSYNYRVCLTDNPTNKISIKPPQDYDAANYELLARWIEARVTAGHKLTLRDFLKYDPLQNRKYDFNNRWPISTDFIGGANQYPEAGWQERIQIAKEHENYLRGFFHFLATDSRTPKSVRDEMKRFGLCKDEFVDNAGWPHQLYVREARRMVSDFVMTEAHVSGERVASKPIGMGAYGTDMHAVRRIVHNGQPMNEGTIGRSVPAPYPISYDAIVPKKNECSNLLVTFALSASHVAFGSIRMEPVFMIISQSAATAACLSIDQNISIQNLPYEQLAKSLRLDKQVLTREDRSD